MSFSIIKQEVRANFNKMAEQQVLFYADIDRDEIWNLYLDGFSEEERQRPNCNSCKSFLRQYAGIVAIVEGQRVNLWEGFVNMPEEFEQSMLNIYEYIKSRPITNVFFNEFQKCGVDKNKDGELNTIWEHFYIHLPKKFVVKNNIDTKRGELRTAKEVFDRALNTISTEAVETVLELIASNSIYRGKEFKAVVQGFKEEKEVWTRLHGEQSELFAWSRLSITNIGVLRIRNSAIGTLLIDLSEGVDLNTAVAKYETKVTPTNYKRTTALINPRMIEEAKQKLEELGLLGSLERRFAIATDLAVDNTLFVDRSAGAFDAFDDMTKDTQKIVKKLTKVDEITMEKFISDVLPTARKVEVLLENVHMNKMVSLITAQDQTAPTLFKWDNLFSWSYTGGITDSIKERVKAAGGQVVGELRCSLSWYNHDDLDIWLRCPNGRTIKYSNKRELGGELDVDMNAGKRSRTPVENIIFTNKSQMAEGNYELMINQFLRRECSNVGYDIQIECQGQVTDIHFDKSPRDTESIVRFNYTKANGIEFQTRVDNKLSTKEVWGLKTNQFVKVKQLLLSPNHWSGNPIGNKHFMFMLEDCISDEEPKPFFNEFLNGRFTENRKVFEVMADKFKVAPSQDQISGIGFSETMPGEVTLRIESTIKRMLKIKF